MELWRFEGISFNTGNNKLYAALTNIGNGMLNNATTMTVVVPTTSGWPLTVADVLWSSMSIQATCA